jgi:putative SOS response-associated peptidase YedK
MCGRFTSRTEPRVLAAHFDAEEIVAEDRGERFNVAPTDPVYGVAQSSSGTRRLGEFRWGLVPFWAEDLSVGARMINARAETILEKPAFRRPLATRRCIIPADGFYEWQALAGSKTKQPWYIARRDGDVLAFAGVWESWRPDKTGDERVVSCAVITTDANEAIGRIHDRMPVVLRPDDWNPWLDPTNTDVEDLVSLLVPAPSELFELTPVGTRVNDVRNDGPELLEPAALPEPEDRDQLF